MCACYTGESRGGCNASVCVSGCVCVCMCVCLCVFLCVCMLCDNHAFMQVCTVAPICHTLASCSAAAPINLARVSSDPPAAITANVVMFNGSPTSHRTGMYAAARNALEHQIGRACMQQQEMHWPSRPGGGRTQQPGGSMVSCNRV